MDDDAKRKYAAKLAAPMDQAGVAASAMALMKLMESRWGAASLDKWTPEVRKAYESLNTMVRYLNGD